MKACYNSTGVGKGYRYLPFLGLRIFDQSLLPFLYCFNVLTYSATCPASFQESQSVSESPDVGTYPATCPAFSQESQTVSKVPDVVRNPATSPASFQVSRSVD